MGQLACDDGNRANGDGCSSDCEVEPFWYCYGGSSSQPDSCKLSVQTLSLQACQDFA